MPEDRWQYEVGKFKGGHGPAVSPIIYKELVVLANDHEGDSSLAAVDRRTGQQRWKVARQCKRTSYSTPCVFEPADRPAELIFTDMHHGVSAVDPQTGRLNWERSVFGEFKQRAIASPVLYDDLVIGLSGFTTGQKNAVALRPQAAGDDVEVEEVYRISRSVPHIPTPIVYGDRMFFLVDRGGIASWINAADGSTVWIKRLGTDFSASPVCVNGVIYAVNDEGVVHVIRAGDEYQLLAEIPLGQSTRATPAVSGGVMYLRTESKLFALGGK